MNRADTILALQKIGRIEITHNDFAEHDVLYKLISPAVYEGHRDRIADSHYTLEFNSNGINICIEKNLGILIIDCMKTADGIDYIYHEWRDLKDGIIADIVDIVIEKLVKKNEPEPEYEYEIRIYHCPEEDGGGFIAEADELVGCIARGRTQEEALKNINEEIKKYIASTMEQESIDTPVYKTDNNPKQILDKLKQDVNINTFHAYTLLLSFSDIKTNLSSDPGGNNLNYKV